jgi:formylglycine-generating enzyme required for sulfatase activity
MSSEENKLIISNTGGLIQKMDHQLEVMNRVLGEITERKTEIITPTDSFIGMRAGEERVWEIAPGLIMTFCWCPPGEFMMGSPETEAGRKYNESQVKATLTKGFWMAKTQVTQAQWQAVMGSNPSYCSGENLPVEQISWYDTREFLTKLNNIIGSDDGGKMVLPTEAQWEYACRAGETGAYSGGTVDQVAWYKDNSGSETHAVGVKKPNAWGLHDMHGNVWEWCYDCYDYELLGNSTDVAWEKVRNRCHGWYEDELCKGCDPEGNMGYYRVYRGGSCDFQTNSCRAASRDVGPPASKNISVGFRVARSSNH